MQVRTAGALGIVAMILASLALAIVLFGNENIASTESDDTSSIFDDSVGTKFSIASSNNLDTDGLTDLSDRIADVELEVKQIKELLGNIPTITQDIQQIHGATQQIYESTVRARDEVLGTRDEVLGTRDEVLETRDEVLETRGELNDAVDYYVDASDFLTNDLTEKINRLPWSTDIVWRTQIRCHWDNVFDIIGIPMETRCGGREDDNDDFRNYIPTALFNNLDLACLGQPAPRQGERPCGAELLEELANPESDTDASIFWSRAMIVLFVPDYLVDYDRVEVSRYRNQQGEEIIRYANVNYRLPETISSCSTDIQGGSWTAQSLERTAYYHPGPGQRRSPSQYVSSNLSLMATSWFGSDIYTDFDSGIPLRDWAGNSADSLFAEYFQHNLTISVGPGEVHWAFVQQQNMDIPSSVWLDFDLVVTCTRTPQND